MGHKSTKLDTKQPEATKPRDHMQEFNDQRERLIADLQSIVSTALRPNGLLPAEIIDMVLNHVAEYEICFRIASCCKLWLSVILPKSYNWLLQRRFLRSNIVNGLFWPTVLLDQYWERDQFEIACDWSMRKNSLIMNNWALINTNPWDNGGFVGKANHLDLTTNKISNEDEFGTFYINNTKIVADYTLVGDVNIMLIVSWKSLTCHNENGSSFKIEYRGYNGDGTRHVTGAANRDGSNQIMLWDCSVNISNQVVEHNIETYDLDTGKQIHSFKQCCKFILGFWRHYVISYNFQILSIRDLNTGITLRNWGINIIEQSQTTLSSLICIRDDIMAVCGEHLVRIYDLENGSMITKIDLAASIGMKKKEQAACKVVAVAFDEWKLVTVTEVSRLYNLPNCTIIEPEMLISIFDVTANYRHLNTIQTEIRGFPSWPTEILLPNNGKILINFKFRKLIEIDFLHPNLMNNNIKLLLCQKNNSTAKIHALSLVNITEHVTKELDVGFDIITSTTYYLQAVNEPLFDANRSQTKRITFIYPINETRDRISCSFTWMNKEEFDRHWKIRLEHFSALLFPTLNRNESHPVNVPRCFPEHMMGDVFFLLFEEFDAQTNQWLITEPFVPHGTNLELSCGQ